jgi:hypothetical protein
MTLGLNLSPLAIIFMSLRPEPTPVQLPLDRAGLHSLTEFHGLPNFAVELDRSHAESIFKMDFHKRPFLTVPAARINAWASGAENPSETAVKNILSQHNRL